MSNETQFSIRLANGQEKTFDSAAEMATWTAEQKANSRPVRKNSSRKHNRKAKRKVRCYSGDSPLSRFVSKDSDPSK